MSRGNLVVQMAPHVSRFVARAVRCRRRKRRRSRAATAAYDDLFRFKIDFVRRRALPLLKGGAQVDGDRRRTTRSWPTSSRPRRTQRSSRAPPMPSWRLPVRAAGCSIVRRRRARAGPKPRRRPSPRDIDALKRWCAAHLHDPRYRDWVVFRFPETLDSEHLVHDPAARTRTARGDDRARREAAPPRRLQADRRALHDRAKC